VKNYRVIVCCGAGGVGKTTASTALALAGARAGRRVLALTIDPSKRLAQTLEVDRNLREPAKVSQRVLDVAGVTDGTLHAWMLDPQLVATRAVDRLAPNSEVASRLKKNRLFRQVSRMVAGMQEFTAMEALHTFLRDGDYDLVILDTPPSRNALDFLEGPRRLERFFDGRLLRLFLTDEPSTFIGRAASALLDGAMSGVFGRDTFSELQEFFGMFEKIFLRLTSNALRTREMLSDADSVAFLLVTTPAPESVSDAELFRKKTEAMGLPFGGFILNRSLSAGPPRQLPTRAMLGKKPSAAALSGLEKLIQLANLEAAEAEKDAEVHRAMTESAGEGRATIALPIWADGAHNATGLALVADALMGIEAD
jgi:anion-transporting  ArsA/GET3 family ATPase